MMLITLNFGLFLVNLLQVIPPLKIIRQNCLGNTLSALILCLYLSVGNEMDICVTFYS